MTGNNIITKIPVFGMAGAESLSSFQKPGGGPGGGGPGGGGPDDVGAEAFPEAALWAANASPPLVFQDNEVA